MVKPENCTYHFQFTFFFEENYVLDKQSALHNIVSSFTLLTIHIFIDYARNINYLLETSVQITTQNE